jgi:hypothetical protein
MEMNLPEGRDRAIKKEQVRAVRSAKKFNLMIGQGAFAFSS